MFDGIHAPLPDAGGYLKRIGIKGGVSIDLDGLDSLIAAHQQTVPFENLDVYDAEREISLNIGDLFDKVVVRRRGGYCFELNGLFMSLLENLGFSCQAVAARVVWRRDCIPPLSHRTTIVTIDNERYFCDVGFGGPSPNRAIRLDGCSEQKAGRDSFRFIRRDREIEFVRLVADRQEPLMIFSDTPFHLVDFIPLNDMSQKTGSQFRSKRVVNLRTKDGSVSIEGDVLRHHSDGQVVDTVLRSEEGMKGALREHFGLQVDFPLKMNCR